MRRSLIKLIFLEDFLEIKIVAVLKREKILEHISNFQRFLALGDRKKIALINFMLDHGDLFTFK